jgi:hypothetical protein
MLGLNPDTITLTKGFAQVFVQQNSKRRMVETPKK